MKTQQFIHHCEIVNYCVPLWLFNPTMAIYIDMNIFLFIIEMSP